MYQKTFKAFQVERASTKEKTRATQEPTWVELADESIPLGPPASFGSIASHFLDFPSGSGVCGGSE